MIIKAKIHNENELIISTEDLRRLVEIVEKIEPVKIEEVNFDSLHSPSGGREDIYTIDDVKVKYNQHEPS